MKEIKTSNAPGAIGPYSQAVKTDHYVFCSGQMGMDKETGEMKEGLEAQTHAILENMTAILEEEGLTLDHVVKTTIFLTDMADFAEVNEIYAGYFSEPYPARSTVAVKELPKKALVEIESIAELN